MIMILAALASASDISAARALAQRVAESPALKQEIDAHAGPVVKCSRRVIGEYVASQGEAGLKTPEQTLSTAILQAGRQCITGGEIAEISSEIRSSIPGADPASAEAVSRTMLSEYVTAAILADSE